MISDQAVKEYQKIFRSTFRQEITFEEAKERGIQLLNLLLLVTTLKSTNTNLEVNICQKDRQNLHKDSTRVI